MSQLKDHITESVKTAMRAKDKARLAVLRMTTAALKQVEVDERIELDDERVLAILDKQIKQRNDAATQYRDAGREDLAAQEEAEAAILREFMPEPLTDADIDQIIANAITETGAESMRDMGRVMAIVKPQVQGRCDMGAVSGRVKAQLN